MSAAMWFVIIVFGLVFVLPVVTDSAIRIIKAIRNDPK